MKNFKIPLLIGLILLITFLTFLPCLKNNFVNWDDNAYITEIITLNHLSLKNIKYIFTSFYASLYQPLNRLSYLCEYTFFKTNPFIYHLTNLILHLFNCLFVFWLVYLFTKRLSISFVTAILFGLHPLHVESVAWVSDRQDLFCALFFLSAIISYCYYLRNEKINRYYYFSLALFVFSLLSKAMAITLPIILFLVDYLMYRKPNKRMFLDKIPFFSLSFIFGIITIIGKYSSGFIINENLIVIPNKVHIIVGSIVFYVNKIFLPVRISCSYPQSVIKNIPFLYSMVAVIILIVGIVVSCKYTRKVIFGSMFFLVTILPVLQVVPTSSAIVADRYIYIPAIGLFYIIACAFGWLYKRKTKNAIYIKSFTSLLLVTIICTLAYLTWEKCHAWKDSITLWTDALKSYPDISVAYNNRGNVYAAKGNHDQAILEYDKAIEINPNYAEAYNNRGSAYNTKGNHNQAISDLNKATELSPNYTDAYYNRGNVYAAKGNHDQAISDYNKSIKLNPRNAEAYHNRGIAYGEEGNYDQAISDFNKAIELNPNLAMAYSSRALVHCFKQEYTKAWDDVRKAKTLGAAINYHFLEYLKKVSGNSGGTYFNSRDTHLIINK